VRLLQRAAPILRRHRRLGRAVQSLWVHGGVLVRYAVGGDPAGEAGAGCGGHPEISS